MSLDANSTLAEWRAQYEENIDYDLTGSEAKARLLVQACRVLLVRLPQMSSHAGMSTVQIDLAVLQRQLDDATRFLAARAGGGGRRFGSLEFFRD